jgi:hypothetical protein
MRRNMRTFDVTLVSDKDFLRLGIRVTTNQESNEGQNVMAGVARSRGLGVGTGSKLRLYPFLLRHSASSTHGPCRRPNLTTDPASSGDAQVKF